MPPSNPIPAGPKPTHTCPVWLGHLLASPLRRLLENPAKLVLPLLAPDAQVLELGPALGFFSLPVAQALGRDGKLVCVDVQEGMLTRLRKRLEKRGLAARTELRLCTQDTLGLADLEGRCDLVLALHVVHETAAPAETIRALTRCLKAGGRLLLIEPPGHCSPEVFQSEVDAALGAGLQRTPHPRAEGRKNLVLLMKAA
jgi:ubiquinone/menaquinone biosynthesis C-methylase UbiE